MDCFWAPYSIQYVINGDQHLVIRNGVAEFVGNETRLRSLAKGVVAGAGGIGDPRVIAGWYLASAAIGGAIYAGLPAAPKVVAAGTQASAAATVAGEAYIGWQNIYRFTSGFVNTNTPPLTEAAFWGNWAGKIFRLLIRQ